MDLNKAKKERDFRKLMGMNLPDVAGAEWEALEEVRDALTPKLDAILNKADAEKRDLTEEEANAYMVGDDLFVSIKNELSKRTSFNTRMPIDPNAPARSIEYGMRVSADGEETRIEKPGGMIGLSYRQLFGLPKGKLDMGGFRNAEEFYQAVASGKWDPRLAKRTMLEGTGSAGGVTVPDNLANTIYQIALEQSIVLPRCRMFPIRYGNNISIPVWDGFDNQSGLFGGFTGQWLGEEMAATAQTPKLNSIELKAYKLAIFVDASNEVIADSMTLETALTGAMQKAVAYLLDEACLLGNGVAKPTGAFNDSSSIAVNRASAGAIGLTDLTNMYARLHPACQRNAVWVCSPSCIPQLCAMTNIGGTNPVFIINASEGIPGTIFGLPVLVSERLEALGTQGDIALVDFSQYAVIMRREISLERSNAPRWSEDVMSYRCIVRANGHAMWVDPMTPRNGGDTLSWCVVLD